MAMLACKYPSTVSSPSARVLNQPVYRCAACEAVSTAALAVSTAALAVSLAAPAAVTSAKLYSNCRVLCTVSAKAASEKPDSA